METNKTSDIYKTWPDGYMVRRMTMEDAKLAQRWFCGICPTSCDLEVALSAFPRDTPGFYVGEYQGEVVASAIRIPVAEGIYYGSYYYVVEKHRRFGFGGRLRDEVAASHVGSNILAIDAHSNLLEMNKRHGYVDSFHVSRFMGTLTKALIPTGKYQLKNVSHTQGELPVVF